MTPEEQAKHFANSTKKISRDCPRGVINPGLYYGFLAGWEAREQAADTWIERVQTAVEEINKDSVNK